MIRLGCIGPNVLVFAEKITGNEWVTRRKCDFMHLANMLTRKNMLSFINCIYDHKNKRVRTICRFMGIKYSFFLSVSQFYGGDCWDIVTFITCGRVKA